MIESRDGKIIQKYFAKEYKSSSYYKEHSLDNIRFTEYSALIEMTEYYVFSIKDISKHFRIICGIPKDGDNIKYSANAIISCGSMYEEFATKLAELSIKHLLVAIGRALACLFIHAYDYGVSDRIGYRLSELLSEDATVNEVFKCKRELPYGIPDDFYKEV